MRGLDSPGGWVGAENRLWGFQFSKAVSWPFINQSWYCSVFSGKAGAERGERKGEGEERVEGVERWGSRGARGRERQKN
jgi:hypothetical protein